MRSKSIKKQQFRRKGKLFVVSAPSGAGKSTLCQKLLGKIQGLKLSVSYTTRPPRKGEINDLHYSFISERKFKGMINRGEFAEWAVVHGNLYGTSIKRLKQMNKDGYDIILDIDVHGAMQLKNTYDNAVYIFLLPPSMQVLKKRLMNRKTDAKEKIAKRLENARAEIARYKDYDYVVINDKLEQASNEFESIITSIKVRTENADHKWINNLIK